MTTRLRIDEITPLMIENSLASFDRSSHTFPSLMSYLHSKARTNTPPHGLIAASMGLFLTVQCLAQTEILPPGFRPVPTGDHALIHARVIPRPGELMTNAVILIHDGRIAQVGTNLTVPPESRVWDMQGLTIYPGFIDSYLGAESEAAAKSEDDDGLRSGGPHFFGVKKSQAEPSGTGYDIARVTPEHRMAETYKPDSKLLEKMRETGFTTANLVPGKGIFRGTSALVNLSDEDPARSLLKPDVFQHIALDARHGEPSVFPVSLMGVVSVVRQSFLDAQYYAKSHEAWMAHPGTGKRPEYNKSLEALSRAVSNQTPFAFEPMDALMVQRSQLIAREMGIPICIISSGEEWLRPDLAKASGATFIVPLNFPELPKMPTEDDWQQVGLDRFRAWDWAPENAAVLQNAGLSIALTTKDLDDKKDFRKNLEKAIARGLTESNALAALTLVPAKLCGMESDLGSIAAGKLANLTVVKGTNYFNPEDKLSAVWIEGRAYPILEDAAEKKSDGTNKVASVEKTEKNASTAKDKDKEKEKDKIVTNLIAGHKITEQKIWGL